MGYSSLHNHTMFSVQDGFSTPKEMLDRASEIGLKAFAITEHNNAYSWCYFDKIKHEYPDIKMIYGNEFYECEDISIKDKDNKYYHLVALARNEEGRKSLNQLITESEFHGKYYKGRVDLKMLKPHAENLIILSACLASKISREDSYEKCIEYINEYKSVFPYFYLEMQSHMHIDQSNYNKKILQLSKDTGTPFVITTDSHAAVKEDLEYQGILVQIARDEDTMSEFYEGCYLQSSDEIHEIMDSQIGYENVELGLKASNEIIDMIDVVNMPFQEPQMPHFDLPEEFNTGREFIEHLILEKGWKHRNFHLLSSEEQQVRKDRIKHELDVIDQMGFCGYFLIVWDFIKYCKNNGIAVGAGRGCFVPNSKVMMANGMLKKIQDVKVGDFVKTHLGNNKQVYNTLSYDVDEKMYKIKAGGFEAIKCTNDHEIYAMKCGKCENNSYKNSWCIPTCRAKDKCKYSQRNEIGWVKAKDLKVGDYLSVPKVQLKKQNKFLIDLAEYAHNEDVIITDNFITMRNPVTKKPYIQSQIKRFIKIDKDFAKLSGYFIGNGHARFDEKNREYRVEISFNSNHHQKIKKCMSLIRDIFGRKVGIAKGHRGKQVIKLSFSSKIASKMFRDLFGDCAFNKKIPDFLICDDKNILKGLLKGLYDTDGYYPNGKENKLVYSTTSESLAFQIQKIWLSLGFYASPVKAKPRNGWRNEIKLNITGSQVIKAKNEVFPNIVPQRTKYNLSNYMETDTHFFVRISNISTFDYKGKVYDLSVEDDVSYNVNGFAVHNSAAGSIVCYLLGITELDPVKYDLIFERFLNIERVSYPDVDVDFADKEKVIEYLMSKYGEERVCQILNFSYITPMIAIKDVGRILRDEDGKALFANYEINQISRYFTERDFDDCFKINGDEIKKFSLEKHSELFRIARALSGRVRHVSIHAGGVGIVNTAVTDYMPMKLGEKNEHIIQVDKLIIEEIGIIKFDILGVKTLSIIEGVKKRAGVSDWEIDPNNKEFLSDKKTYDLLETGRTNNVFQVESQGMKELLKRLKPRTIEDVSAVLALYRPDSMMYLEDYIYFKDRQNEIKYLHPDMKPILQTTYSCLIYQEQLMDIVRKFGNGSYGRSDKFRRAIGKKIPEEVVSESIKLKDEIIAAGYPLEIAEAISNELKDKGGYLFNKSHSMSYAVTTLQTAYLKAHYPTEFFCEVFNMCDGDNSKLNKYLVEAQEDNIIVLPPHINRSGSKFDIFDNKILFGLSSINQIGVSVVEEIINERNTNGNFEGLDDFLNRVKCNSAQVVMLIKSGALPTKNKRNMLLRYASRVSETDSVYKEYSDVKTLPTLLELNTKWGIDTNVVKDKAERLKLYNAKRKIEHDTTKYQEWLLKQQEKKERAMETFISKYMENEQFWEFEALSVFLNENPFADIVQYNNENFYDCEVGDECVIIGIISKIQKKKDRHKRDYAFLNVYESNGILEGIAWSSIYSKHIDLIKKGNKLAFYTEKSGEDNFIIKRIKTIDKWIAERKLQDMVNL